MKGHIQRRGKNSWRLKYDVGTDPIAGSRRTRYKTFKGTKREAQNELAKLIAEAATLTSFDDKTTVAEFMANWIVAASRSISPKTSERYEQLARHQIIPHLGMIRLFKLTAQHIAQWHARLLSGGRENGRHLSAQSVRHAHRVLHKAMSDAVKQDLLVRNPVSRATPPRIESAELPILTADQIGLVLSALSGADILAPVIILLSTGLRRGELMALQWGDIDFENRRLAVERSVEVTKAHGLRLKSPKTRHGRRSITLPTFAIDALREHRLRAQENLLALGLGKMVSTDFVFGNPDGSLRHPNWITYRWKTDVARLKLPRVTLHALRHSHASALIASGQDIVTVSRRLGHAGPAITLSVYAHLFNKSDQGAADAVDRLLKPTKNGA